MCHFLCYPLLLLAKHQRIEKHWHLHILFAGEMEIIRFIHKYLQVLTMFYYTDCENHQSGLYVCKVEWFHREWGCNIEIIFTCCFIVLYTFKLKQIAFDTMWLRVTSMECVKHVVHICEAIVWGYRFSKIAVYYDILSHRIKCRFIK